MAIAKKTPNHVLGMFNKEYIPIELPPYLSTPSIDNQKGIAHHRKMVTHQ